MKNILFTGLFLFGISSGLVTTSIQKQSAIASVNPIQEELVANNLNASLAGSTLEEKHHSSNVNLVGLNDDQLGNDLAGLIIKYMLKKGYNISTKPGEYNIVYVEGMNLDGTLNNDWPNEFNDLRLIIEFINGKPQIIGKWEATTEPGKFYTYNKMNPKGAARIKFGQYKSWKIGTHKDHEALVQIGGSVTVHRDLDMNFIRTGDQLDIGFFGINQHWGYDNPSNNVNKASAGCLVGRSKQGHREFMSIIKKDKRYQTNRNYVFESTIIPGDEL